MKATTIKKVIPIALLLLTLNTVTAFAQTGGITYVPCDSSIIGLSFGTGLGVPYGTFGGKAVLSADPIAGEIGIGLMPFIWDVAISLGGSIHFRDRYSAIRPKISVSYSNIAAATFILDEIDLSTLYEETFAGIGLFLGIDWRPTETSAFCLDLNIGWIFPFVGNDEILNRYDKAVDDLADRGYIITEEMKSLNTPKVSIGIIFNPQRTLKPVYSN